jgi:hypothetical protein
MPTEAVKDDKGAAPMMPAPPGTPDGGGADFNYHTTRACSLHHADGGHGEIDLLSDFPETRRVVIHLLLNGFQL